MHGTDVPGHGLRLAAQLATRNPTMPDRYAHGPENAEHELRKAYNGVIESGVTHSWDKGPISGVNPTELTEMYKKAFDAFRRGDRLTAERWARSAKHLARAFWHEAKIDYLEKHPTDVPFLEGAAAEEYNLHEHSDTSEDLLASVEDHIPAGFTEMPKQMRHYASRGHIHLKKLEEPEYKHELLRAERIKAAHEYGRTVECMTLAYEAEAAGPKAA